VNNLNFLSDMPAYRHLPRKAIGSCATEIEAAEIFISPKRPAAQITVAKDNFGSLMEWFLRDMNPRGLIESLIVDSNSCFEPLIDKMRTAKDFWSENKTSYLRASQDHDDPIILSSLLI
jgi:hypothetical protein